MIAQWFPQIRIVGQRHILSRLAVGQSISARLLVRMFPAFMSRLAQINFSIDDASTVIQVCLDRTVGIENTTATSKLYAALKPIAVGCNEIDTIFESSRHPPATRTFFI